MAIQVPVFSTRYTVINDGAGNSTPVEMGIDAAAVQLTFQADTTNTNFLYIECKRDDQTAIVSAVPIAFSVHLLPGQVFQMNCDNASQRLPGRLYLYGDTNGDHLYMTQLIRLLR